MNITRAAIAVVPAGAITGLLLLSMHLLIASNFEEPKEGEEFKIPDISMPERELSSDKTQKPDKPEEPEEPPPELPEPEFDNPDINVDLQISANVGAKMDIGGIGGFNSDGDYLPIVKAAAAYPRSALSRGLEGYCTVEYTVTAQGTTRDVTVVDCPQTIFAKPSIKAALKFKYKPKVIDGEPIEVPGVRNKFTFQMAK